MIFFFFKEDDIQQWFGNFNLENEIMNHAKTILSYQKCCLVSKLYLTLCDPMDCRMPVFSVLMGFSKQEYWSGLPFPSPGDLVSSPNPGIELESHASPALTGRFFIWETPYKKQMEINIKKKEKHRAPNCLCCGPNAVSMLRHSLNPK